MRIVNIHQNIASSDDVQRITVEQMQDNPLRAVVFEVFFPTMQRFFEVSVHPALAYQFWLTNGQPGVKKVQFENHWSWAGWSLETRSGEWRVGAGANPDWIVLRAKSKQPYLQHEEMQVELQRLNAPYVRLRQVHIADRSEDFMRGDC